MNAVTDQHSVDGLNSKVIRRAGSDFHAVAGIEPSGLNRTDSSEKRKPPSPIMLRLTA